VISVVIPAHNEEAYLGPCLEAVASAASGLSEDVETVVVLNRCTDGTRAIAESRGARTIEDDSRCLSAIRNRGVAAARGDIIVTCDADSRIHASMLRAALQELADGAVGGGVPVRFDRSSMGITFTAGLLDVVVWLTGLSCGAFWTTREGFEAIGGFDESKPMSEDIDFARRLKVWGKPRGAGYRTLKGAPLVTSSRKFDAFGDWSFLRMMFVDAFRIRRSLKGVDTDFVDEYFYDFNDAPRPGLEPPTDHSPG